MSTLSILPVARKPLTPETKLGFNHRKCSAITTLCASGCVPGRWHVLNVIDPFDFSRLLGSPGARLSGLTFQFAIFSPLAFSGSFSSKIPSLQRLIRKLLRILGAYNTFYAAHALPHRRNITTLYLSMASHQHSLSRVSRILETPWVATLFAAVLPALCTATLVPLAIVAGSSQKTIRYIGERLELVLDQAVIDGWTQETSGTATNLMTSLLKATELTVKKSRWEWRLSLRGTSFSLLLRFFLSSSFLQETTDHLRTEI